ncbi:MAG: mrcA 2, partial [Spartobacteria bacterium]|nr:mrcA 2 [Spartobacteria bacterium]
MFGEGAEHGTRGRVRSPEWRVRVLSAVALVCVSIILAWFFLPKPPLLDGIPFSQAVWDRNGKLLRLTLATDQKFRIRTSLDHISPELIDATLRYEDRYYAQHPGVNPVALLRSGYRLLARARIRTGASTVTMQLARLRFHLQTRSIPGKFRQIINALELERHYSKREILEAYLNLAPYGRNIEGVGAASQIYFDKSPANLTAPQAVALSVIPQSPARRALFSDRDNPSVNAAQNNWYDRVGLNPNAELSGRQFKARAQNEHKFSAPHFVQQSLANEKDHVRNPATLDLEKQELVERRIRDYIAVNRSRGIQNAASFLIDSRTMEVLAQVGSADFNNGGISGQVDGTRSLRSPGSTLKPFVYALALDQGLIHPLSILSDAPRSFGEYNPENFDHDFLGPIRACDALARSRNIPAVTLASHLSHPTLYEFLRNAGVALPQPNAFY